MELKFYEIRNRKTQQMVQVYGVNFMAACRLVGWKPQDCKCVWAAKPENAGNPANY